MSRALWRTLTIGASVCVPFAIQAALVLLRAPLPTTVPGISYVVSISAGFLLLVLEFRVYAILIGLVYLPAMALSLMYFTLVLAVRFFGEGP